MVARRKVASHSACYVDFVDRGNVDVGELSLSDSDAQFSSPGKIAASKAINFHQIHFENLHRAGNVP